MTLEELLIDKLYYKNTFMKDEQYEHPVHVLGEAYLAEHRNEISDLSFIRFAQGEVYFHNKDYETAIFKWENIENELQPWAQMNMADAYFELGLFSAAEDLYRSITSDSTVLTTELLLKLFSVYKEQGKLDKAVETIKEAVSYNPDYLDITEIARLFFEEHQDWKNAVELAVNESTRTVSPRWFEILRMYSEEGKTSKFDPSYFSKTLISLYIENQVLFEKLVSSLWKSYRNEKKEIYLTWLKEINHLLMNIEDDRNVEWHELSSLYQESYAELINGKLLLKDLSKIIPYHLENWIKITDSTHALAASAAMLSWEEIFPSSFNTSVIHEAENLICHSRNEIDVLEESLKLFETMLGWAKNQEVLVGYSLKWIIRELLDLRAHNLLVASSDEKGKVDFIHSVLGGHVFGSPSESFVMYKDHDDFEIAEITQTGIRMIENAEEYREIAPKKTIIDFKLPSEFLNENSITLLDSPINGWNNSKRDQVNPDPHLSDAVLVVISPEEYNLSYLIELQNKVQNVPFYFVINQMETSSNDQELKMLIEEVHSQFPYASVITYNKQTEINELNKFIQAITKDLKLEEIRTSKMLSFIRAFMANILDQRVQLENNLIESIKWDEEMANKLGGAIHQLQDMEKEKVRSITSAYHSIKDDIKQDLAQSIPNILRSCSDLIKEDSDFRKIHLELNEKMNTRIQDHLQKNTLPKFYTSIQNWITIAEEEFYQSKTYLEEMREGFNTLYGEERLKLCGDDRVLDDWRRDAERMKNGIRFEKVNILLRHTPSQVLLKSAGKLFGALQQNKTMLYNRYKKFVENEDYQAVVDSIANKFLMQFELFETSLDRDISMFFQNPLAEIEKTVKLTLAEREENENMLNKIKSNPELFRDPLSLFEVKLRQYEWIVDASKETYQVN
ncbi:tetratricopeptide repeat protein [Heyndrickxia sp. NPDC080065]|uniref:tetratricopeptide repeat protein n=1 Tax=Heyndrickxia sp. NPDC080065 TaxID=3390568 RepID=UPI003CFF2E88